MKRSKAIPFLLLVSRLVLFLFFQALIAFYFTSWEGSEKYWLLTATLTNIVSISLLYFLFRKDGANFLDIFRFERQGIKNDLLVFSGLLLLSIPVLFAPGYLLARLLWDNPDTPNQLMFGALNKYLVYILMIAFPVTIALAELATYFKYIMPKFRKQFRSKWLALLLPVVFLSLQHCTLPFVPDIHFIIYRALSFLPFATLVGITIYYRPSLFPYFAIFHGVLDFGTSLMFLQQIQ